VTNRSRRLVIILSAVVLVLSLLAGLAAATTGFFGLAYDKAVEQVEERSSYQEGPWLREDPKPGEEQDEASTEEEEHGKQNTGATD
jgi:ABC-type cobalt transport system substrate-binding protein